MTYRSIVTFAKSNVMVRTMVEANSRHEAEIRSINKIRSMFMDCELKDMGKPSAKCAEVGNEKKQA